MDHVTQTTRMNGMNGMTGMTGMTSKLAPGDKTSDELAAPASTLGQPPSSGPSHTPPLQLVGGRDEIFAAPGFPKPFAFNDEVAQVFDDMAQRSIPLYRDVTRSVADWTLRYYQPGSAVYDIGCSTGTTLELIARTLDAAGHQRAQLVGLDTSAPMLERAAAKLKPWADRHRISLSCVDAGRARFDDGSVVVINYTLQFIPVAHRRDLLRQVYSGLRPGGLLYLSDKVRSASPEFQASNTLFYERFKEDQGYSRTEIERKKEALDQVLVPLTFEEQIALVRSAGFDFCEPVLKWNNFLSLVALKR